MRASLTLLLLLLFTLNLRSQGFIKTYFEGTSSHANAISVAQNGDLLITGGHFRSGANFDLYVLRLNSSGDTIWTRTFGKDEPGMASFRSEIGTDILEDQQGNIIVVGHQSNVGTSDYQASVFLKLDANGTLLSNKISTGFNINSITTDGSGNYLHASGGLVGLGASNAYIGKMDANNTLINGNNFFAYNSNTPVGLLDIDKLGQNYYACGYADDGGSALGGLLSKIDANGNLIGSIECHSFMFSLIFMNCIMNLDNQSLIVGGKWGFTSQTYNGFLTKIDSLGNIEWEYAVANSGAQSSNTHFNQVLKLSNGNIAACGVYDTIYGNYTYKGLVTILDPNGTYISQKVIGDTSAVYLKDIVENGNYLYAVGQIVDPSNGSSESIIIKSDFTNPHNCWETELSNNDASFGPSWSPSSIYNPSSTNGFNTTIYPLIEEYGVTSEALCTNFSSIEAQNQHNITIYPNPSHDLLWFKTNHLEEITKIQVIDMKGRNVSNITVRGTNNIDVKQLTSGLYHICFEFADGSYNSLKFVVE